MKKNNKRTRPQQKLSKKKQRAKAIKTEQKYAALRAITRRQYDLNKQKSDIRRVAADLGMDDPFAGENPVFKDPLPGNFR